MKAIRLLYVKNVISRKHGIAQQELTFFMLIENLAYEKHVAVLWTGEDGIWRTLKAKYHSSVGAHQEYWQARATFQLSPEVSLPGNIQFALRYRVLGNEYWDNNHAKNYSIDADSGVRVQEGIPLRNVGFCPTLHQGQRFYPVTIAVHYSLHPQHVSITWTMNNWKSSHRTPCFFRRNHWDHRSRSNARNPNRYGWEIWAGGLKIDDAYRVEYAIACETEGRTIWDNNFGKNYIAHQKRLKLLTLNLHCYQEEGQEHKFAQIAKAIRDLDIDIVCLQEVGEYWNNGSGDWNSNAAKIINEHLSRPYHLYTDWSHIGFGKYREGIAILSKYHFLIQDSSYVSSSRDVQNIHSRKVLMVQVHVPYMGLVNVFSTHLSWWSDGFREQFETLRKWANHKHSSHVAATLLCGDFNIKAGSQGYVLVTRTKEYEDQFLKMTSPDVFVEVFGQSSQNCAQHLADDRRIDYIFMKKGSNLKVTSAKVLFTEYDYGRVSDHFGYYMEFEPHLKN